MPRSSEIGDALGGQDRPDTEMQLDAVIDRMRRCTWRPRSSELRDTIGCRNHVSLEIHLVGVIE